MWKTKELTFVIQSKSPFLNLPQNSNTRINYMPSIGHRHVDSGLDTTSTWANPTWQRCWIRVALPGELRVHTPLHNGSSFSGWSYTGKTDWKPVIESPLHVSIMHRRLRELTASFCSAAQGRQRHLLTATHSIIHGNKTKTSRHRWNPQENLQFPFVSNCNTLLQCY